MKKLTVELLSGVLALLPYTAMYAQADDVLVYNPIVQTIHTATAKTTETSSYKDYVGVYVRARVMRTFLDVFPNATQVQWHLSDNQYLASFQQEGRLCKALFDNKGGLLYIIQYGTEKNLPRDVRQMVHFAYFAYRITSVSAVEMNQAKGWIINLQDGNRLIVVQVVDGALEELNHYKTHL